MTIRSDFGRQVLTAAGETLLREQLLAVSGVRDAAVRWRMNEAGSLVSLVYLVAAQVPSESIWRRILDQHHRPWAVVQLSDLPYDGAGRLDEQRLQSFPVITSDLVAALPFSEGAAYALRRTLHWSEAETAIVHSDAPSLISGGFLEDAPLSRSCLSDALDQTAENADERGIILIDGAGGERELSYHSLRQAALRVAGGLQAHGAAPGAALLLQLADPLNYVVAFWGAVYAGLRPVLLGVPARYRHDDQAAVRLLDATAIFNNSMTICERNTTSALEGFIPGAVVVDIEALAEAEPVESPYLAHPTETAIYLLTSGSTSKPKAVPQSHANLLAHCRGAKVAHALRADEVSLNWLPLDHVGGIVMFHLRDLYHGFRQVHAPIGAFLQDPLRWLDWITWYKITVSWAPNFAYDLVSAAIEKHGARDWDLSALRFLLNGGEAVVRAQAETFLRVLQPFGLAMTAMRPAWGMSETCSDTVVCTQFLDDMQDGIKGPVSVGRPYPGISVRIVDKGGQVVTQGTTGLLHIKGASVLASYCRNDEANKSSFTSDGWFNTGDLGAISNGQLYLMGRSKDLIIANGQNIDPAVIEGLINAIDGVRLSFTSVISRRSEHGSTDRIAVFFVPAHADAPLEPVLQTIRSRVNSNFGIQIAEIVALSAADVPKTSIGKIQKEILKSGLVAGSLVPVYRRPEADKIVTADVTQVQQLWRRIWRKRQCQAGSLPSAITLIAAEGVPTPDLARDFELHGVAVATITLDVLALDLAPPGQPFVMFAGESFDPADLLVALQHLGKAHDRAPWRLLVARHVASNDCVASLLRSAMDEYPALTARCVVIDSLARDGVASIILNELADRCREVEVAYRTGKRFVSRLAPASPPRPDHTLRLEDGGFYLVTGGLGGLGLHLCNHLIENYSAGLVIVGRRELHALDREAAAALHSLQDRAEVIYLAADCGALGFAEDVAIRLQDWGLCALDGVFHSAGAITASSMADLNPQTLRASVAMRARQCQATYEVAARLDASFMVQFSSLNGYFGGAGVSAYAAACRQQMAIAEALDGCPGPKLRCINWSMWKDTGMLRAYDLAALGERRGYRQLQPEQALKALEAVLASPDSVIFIGLDETNLFMHRETVADAVALDSIEVVPSDRRGFAMAPVVDMFGTPVPIVRADESVRVPTASIVPDATSIVDTITLTVSQIWRDVLELNFLPTLSDNVFDLGGQSLLMPRLQNVIQTTLNVEIDILDLFDYVTLGALAEFVRGKLAAQSA